MEHPAEAITFDLTGYPTVRGQVWGTDQDTVLLVHGIGGDIDSWGAVPQVLAADGYRVVGIDLPGHGLSDDWTGAENWAGLIAALVVSVRERWSGHLFGAAMDKVVPLLD